MVEAFVQGIDWKVVGTILVVAGIVLVYIITRKPQD